MATSVGNVVVAGENTATAAAGATPLEAVSRRCKGAVIKAKAGNTNAIFIGGADVDTATNDGFDASKGLVIKGHFDTGEVYFAVTTDSEGVDFWLTLV